MRILGESRSRLIFFSNYKQEDSDDSLKIWLRARMYKIIRYIISNPSW